MTTQEIDIYKDKHFIMLKSGLTFDISPETATRVEQVLAGGEGHRFIKLTEANATINTAEVEGVYTKAQYDDLSKLKQKMWQCSHRVWHKQREECECGRLVKEKIEQVRRLRHRLANESDLDEITKTSLEQYAAGGIRWLATRGVIIN